ncbi:glycosyltransferase [uncultured Pseudodesulfovibrio sp.]|uniref:glycosyltransferase n=1 Tax=uncultured Pseudodesulfovibrio sp. TaxID=2035858 RepID=UPI0029C71F6A|nr:glycosyltransferase [uncultured Pseudodesulfovibrio sp.]
MLHIPVQILANNHEFNRYILDCVQSLKSQLGVGTKYCLTINVVTYEPVSKQLSERLCQLAEEHVAVNHIRIERSCGYGEKQNLIWTEYTKRLQTPFDAFLTINPDIILMPDVIDKLYETFASGDDVNIVEARQFPIENPPRVFDTETLEVNWCSGACILISASFFERCGGFDEAIFLYCEDVDLSWRAWLDGGRCLYRYDAVVAHMTQGLFEKRYNPNSVAAHEENMALSYLILAWKYFSTDEQDFAEKMDFFRDNQWLTERTKENAIERLEALKPRLTRYAETHPRIEIRNFGVYSGMRSDLI